MLKKKVNDLTGYVENVSANAWSAYQLADSVHSTFVNFSENISIDEQTFANLSLTFWTCISSAAHHADDQVGNLWEYCVNLSKSYYNTYALVDRTNVSLGSFMNTSYYNMCLLLDCTNVSLGTFTNTSYRNSGLILD